MIRSVLHMVWIVVTVVPWTMGVLLASLLPPRSRAWWVAVNWFRVVMWGTRVILGIRMDITGLERLPQDGRRPVVLLSKHQSALETLWIPTVMQRPLAFVFKRELLRIPFFGWSMARLDMIHIDRESRAAAMKLVIDQGRRLLAQGNWVIMFPEGTRIARGESGTYQTAGTRLAVEAGADVVPIALATARCWPRDGFVKRPGVVRMSIGPAISSQDRDPKDLMREAQRWIEDEMRRLDPEAYGRDQEAA